MTDNEFADMTLFELLKWDFETKDEDVALFDWIEKLESEYPFSTIFENINTNRKDIARIEKKLDKLISVLDRVGNVKFEISLEEWLNQ